MNYIGKMWVKPTSMENIAEMAALKDIKIFRDTEDAVGVMEFHGDMILVLLHTSWGNVDEVRKLKISTHHTSEDSNDELYRIFEERLREAMKE